jgi:universal stress protein E
MMSRDPSIGGGTIKRVLIVDTPDHDSDTLRAGVAFADRQGADIVILVPVMPPANLSPLLPTLGVSWQEVTARLEKTKAAAMKEKLKHAFADRAFDVQVVVGRPFVEIIHAVTRLDIDMVIKLAEALDVPADHVFASTDQHLLRKCPCKIWLRQPRGERDHINILAAIDVDFEDADEPETLRKLNGDILAAAVDLATGTAATLHVVHAWQPPSAVLMRSLFPAATWHPDAHGRAITASRQEALRALLETKRDQISGLAQEPQVHVRTGNPRQVIADLIDDLKIGVLVMGTVARTGLQGIIIGNTAEDTFNSVSRSLVAVKPADFVSPLTWE